VSAAGPRSMYPRPSGCYRDSCIVTPGRRRHRYTYAEYVALERESPTKHEFFDGEIYAMAGGSEDHSALALNGVIDTSVNEASCQARWRPCRLAST